MASSNETIEAHEPVLSFRPATLAVHVDDRFALTTDVAPPMHVSTTYRYPSDPDELVPVADEDLDISTAPFIYSRLASPNTNRFEAILSSLLGARALSYGSGLAAFHAMMVYFRPNVIAIGEGYHGCHGILGILTRLYGLKKVTLDNEAEWDAAGLGKGDIVHVETPLNPTGEAVNLAKYRELASKRGALLTVDATFGPPGLQDPFALGADVVMHSGTKYFGGHSDMLCGVLATKNDEWFKGLFTERLFLGATMGNLESWLGTRSLRTLELRVGRQSQNAEKLVAWLDELMTGNQSGDGEVVRASVEKVQHASLQKEDIHWIKKQMPGGYGPVFSLWAKTPEIARRLPSKLKLFHHATSLGGVESLVEWRRMSDQTVDERVVRVSVGVENWEDLRDDLLNAFKALVQ
ncbi:cystathionine gamma-synthase [Trichodelitschia bisporula]|uniref:Cystathionine gamma-synthase n=1 Tax=Trichodelitschia bisporula TaxID=703511 RepID=A0A6G1I703_9PEZI|nr:cystathionine gamma-synthase [Trichodelitschia bisporula]